MKKFVKWGGLLTLATAATVLVFLLRNGFSEKVRNLSMAPAVPALSSVVQPPLDQKPFRKIPLPPSGQKLAAALAAGFGPQVVPEFSGSGRLVALRGVLGQGNTSPEFDPADLKIVQARAREVMQVAGEGIGIRVDSPLREGNARTGPLSAQVFYQQTFDGLDVFPEGQIKVDLGTHGELVGLESDYISTLSPTGSFKLTPEQAQLGARAVLAEGGLQPNELRDPVRIVWNSSERPRFAYRFLAMGRQVVIDAETGKILSQKDRRQY